MFSKNVIKKKYIFGKLEIRERDPKKVGVMLDPKTVMFGENPELK